MPVNIAKLRDQARTYEAREQWREAIAAYRQILENPEGGDVDIGLWNRIGDMHLRLNEQDKAVEAYESAVNAYVDVSLYNNAIALCRKILRLVPGRANVYRRLGQISAAKGFFADARQNFLEYADRMRRAGQIDAAFEGLREFADLSPDDAEIRRVLADQLLAHGHRDEAVEQLRILLGMLLARGDEEAAEAVRQQIRAVDANASTEPLARTEQSAHADDFHTFRADLDEEPKRPEVSMGAARPDAHDTAGPTLVVEGLEQSMDFSRPAAEHPAPVAGGTTPVELDVGEELGADLPLMDLGDASAEAGAGYGEITLEPTSLSDADEAGSAADEVESGAGLDLPLMDLEEDTAGGASPGPVEGLEPTSAPDAYGSVDLPLDSFGAGETGADAEGAVDLPMLDTGAEAAGNDLYGTVELPGAGAGAAEGYGSVDLPLMEEPAAAQPAVPADPEAALHARLRADPGDHAAREELVDLLHGRGQDKAAVELLEEGHRQLAEQSRWRDAIVSLSHLIRLRPANQGPLLQKRVEYAFRSGDRTAMVEAYLALGRHFEAEEKLDKARAVYGRVLEIEPPNAEARDAIAALDARAAPAAAAAAPVQSAASGYIDLGALILDEETEASTRFIVEEHEPTGDEDRDFADMLAHFRQKVAENIEVEDSSSHYDLGLAFKEMGLVDEAIAEFQVALRGGSDPLATLEMLGACFADKGQYAVATRVLERALRLPTTTDAELVGVLYQLGRSYESIGNHAQATEYYERVLSVDIRFRDTAARLEAMRRKSGAA